MQIYDLANLFSPSPKDWSYPFPSKAFSTNIRLKLQRTFGKTLAAADLSRRLEPASLGIALRNYCPGDRANAISVPHYLKTKEIMTRIDWGQGRQEHAIVFHGYKNFEYGFSPDKGNKGQVALAVAAIIQKMHLSLGQKCNLEHVTTVDIDNYFKQRAQYVMQKNICYLITDALFDPQTLEASALRLQTALQIFPKGKVVVVVVRDSTEWFENNPLKETSQQLFPFADTHQQAQYPLRTSGNSYTTHLYEQWLSLEKALKNKCFLIPVTGYTMTENFISALQLMLLAR